LSASLLVVFYSNPDLYPPTFNAVRLFHEAGLRVRMITRADTSPQKISWPGGVVDTRVGPCVSDREKNASSAASKLREYLAFAWAVRRALHEDPPAVAYAYEPHALTALTLAGCRAPIVYHRHEAEDDGPIERRTLQGWVQAAARLRAPRAALVVFPEQHRAADYQRIARDPRPPLVVPNFPLRAAFPAPDLRALFDDRLRAPVALYRGAIGAGNGVFQMVRALAQLDPRVALRLCGTAAPELVREFSALAASLGVAERLRYDGLVPFERLNRETVRAAVGLVLYQAVSTNLEHNVSATNKLYEYAACGLPVVAPDRPGFRAYLGGEAWVELADAADPAAVARALGAVLADRARYEERARAARRAFEERFNFERVFAPLLARVMELSYARDR
jgi:glycosyltransferase involved in cell wall biosynthesis